jgi:RNA polymerase sigma-70 factor (ECF subfamily)
MQCGSSVPDHDQQQRLIEAFLTGDRQAAEALYDLIQPAVLTAVRRFFAPDHQDCDDVVQEAILAVFAYVKRDEGFTGNLRGFAAAVARNRCRDIERHRQRFPHVPIETLHEWIADPGKSPLDFLAEAEADSVLQRAVSSLGERCRDLIGSLYFKGDSAEEIRRELGLKSVQAVYYRRDICLQKILKIVRKKLSLRALFGRDQE